MNSISQVPNFQSGVGRSISSEPKTSFAKQEYDERHFRQRYINAIQKIANEWNKTAKFKENKYYKIEFSEFNFKLKEMNDKYSNERVTYFTTAGLEDMQVYSINGLLYNSDLKLYNSSKKLEENDGEGEMVIMDRLGSLFIAAKVRGALHHSSFFSGEPVAFAALCEVKDGKIQKMVRYSGHYTPGAYEESSFDRLLKNQYLKLEPIPATLKIDEQGNTIQTISISSKQKVEELYDLIAKVGDFIRPRLKLICNGEAVPTPRYINGECIDITIEDTKLKSGCMIKALEFRETPYSRIYPESLFELTINQSEEDRKLSVDDQKITNKQISLLPLNITSLSLNSVPKRDGHLIPAKFVHESGDWSYFNSGADLNRIMKFKSTTAYSMISSFDVLGYRDGDLAIFLHFKEKGESVSRYLQSFNIKPEFYEANAGFLKTRSRQQVEQVFSMLCNYNEIPIDKIDKCKTALKLA